MHSRRAKVHDNLGNKSLISARARRNLLIFGSTYPGITPETGDWERKAMSNGEYGGKQYICGYPAIRACTGPCSRRAKIQSQVWTSR
jgi:hypothetical protein